jgi:phage anti-repressor protein
MNELIKVQGRYVGEGEDVVQTVSTRELQRFLGVRKDFSNWIKDQLERARPVRWA